MELILTDREKTILGYAIEDCEPERIASQKAAADTFGQDVNERFAPGSFGHFEVGDRAHIMINNWEDYIMGHPSLAMHPEIYRMARMAEQFMLEVYQRMMCMDDDGTKMDLALRGLENE